MIKTEGAEKKHVIKIAQSGTRMSPSAYACAITSTITYFKETEHKSYSMI